MFFQTKAFLTKKSQKKGFFLFPTKAKGVKKKSEFQNLASKNPNW